MSTDQDIFDTVRAPRSRKFDLLRRGIAKLRFSLRSLLLFFLASGVVIGWIHKRWQIAERVARAAPMAMVWNMTFDDEQPPMHDFLFGDDSPAYYASGLWLGVQEPVWDQQLADIAWMTHLRSLSVHTFATDQGMRSLRGLTGLRDLRFSSYYATDGGLVHLQGLTRLESLLLDVPKMTDAGISHLAGLPNLKQLGIIGRQNISDAAIDILMNFPRLESLALHGDGITNDGLAKLASSTALKSLALGGKNITDTGVVRLQRMTQLRALGLAGAQVTDAGLEGLQSLEALETLDLALTQVSDNGLAPPASLPRLEALNLSSTAISDAGIDHLRKFRRLRRVNLYGTRVSEKAAMDLKQALPDCTISFAEYRWEPLAPGEFVTSSNPEPKRGSTEGLRQMRHSSNGM
jgi:hypothetical protein